MNFSVLIYICVFVISNGVITSAGSVKWHDCGSKANVTDLRVTGCTSQPCVFYKDHEYSIELDAIAPIKTSSLPYKVTAHIVFDITLLKGNSCDNLLKGSCPTQVGEFLTYRSPTIHIDKSFPSISTTVRALVLDDRKNKMVCAELKATIKKSPVYDLKFLLNFIQHNTILYTYE